MIKIATISFLVIVASRLGLAQADGPPRVEDTPQSRHAAYSQLNRQIYARHADTGSGQLNESHDSMQAASERLGKMMTNEIEIALGAAKTSASNITAAISKLQGDLTLSAYDPDPQVTNTPFAELFSLNGIQTAAVAYVIMQGADAIPDTQPYLNFYDKASGIWKERAEAPTLADFEGCTFSVAQLKSGVPGEVWFLTWGQPFGDSRGTKHVRLYAFDGGDVRTIWRRDSLGGGRIMTTADTVTLDYFDADDPSIEKHEVFHVTANGPELVTQSSKQW